LLPRRIVEILPDNLLSLLGHSPDIGHFEPKCKLGSDTTRIERKCANNVGTMVVVVLQAKVLY
jgi:hypothetical protein